MIDWHSSMQQTYEFYEVDPGTWKDKMRLSNILSCKIDRDLNTNTLENATIETTEVLGECYIRIYMIVIQNGVRYREALGTFMVQTPSVTFDGKVRKISMDAYSPLIELKDQYPPIGYTVAKNQNIMDNVCALTKEHMRAPVIPVKDASDTLQSNFTAESNETWLGYLIALMNNTKYSYALDEFGRVLFSPKQETDALQPRWTYSDDDDSILLPSATDDYDLYGIPNVVEVVYSGQDAKGNSLILESRVVNDNPDSPTSTVTRGREVVYRETSPSINGIPDQTYIDQYAKQLLKDLNSVEHTVSYTHGYCPVRVGDCVRLNYKRAGLTDIKAKVITQSIKCSSGCTVTETAVYTSNLWKEA